jgi:hypothetical protein
MYFYRKSVGYRYIGKKFIYLLNRRPFNLFLGIKLAKFFYVLKEEEFNRAAKTPQKFQISKKKALVISIEFVKLKSIRIYSKVNNQEGSYGRNNIDDGGNQEVFPFQGICGSGLYQE